MSADGFPLYEDDAPHLSGRERELFEAVSRERVWTDLERLCEFEREPGTEDERRAAGYLTDRLEAAGIPYDRHEPEFWLANPRSASLEAAGPIDLAYDDGGHRPSIKARPFSGSGCVTGQVTTARVPAEAAETLLWEAPLSEICAIHGDVENRIVLVDVDPAFPLFGYIQLATRLVRTFERRGALGAVLVYPNDPEPRYAIPHTPIWGAVPGPDETDLVPSLPILNVARSVGDELLAGTEADEPLRVTIEADVARRWVTSPIVVAEVQALTDTDDFVLLHGHLDAFDVGATDNATGDVTMIECARVLHEHRNALERNLRVAFWPMHETGKYQGSTWYADTFAHDLLDNCVAHVNVDSTGVADATEFGSAVWMPEAADLCRTAIADVAGKDAEGGRPPRAGDQSFENLGVTAMLMTSSTIPEPIREERGYLPGSGSGGNSEIHHLSTNTIDHADPDVLVRDTGVYLVIAYRLLARDVLPLDYQRTVERHREVVDKYDDDAGETFDLSPVRSRLDRLDDRLDALYEAVDSDHVDAERANETLKRVSRHLVRPSFANRGRFEQDLAVGRPPYPGLRPATELPSLDEDERRFRTVHLVRTRNAVIQELREACRTVESALGE